MRKPNKEKKIKRRSIKSKKVFIDYDTVDSKRYVIDSINSKIDEEISKKEEEKLGIRNRVCIPNLHLFNCDDKPAVYKQKSDESPLYFYKLETQEKKIIVIPISNSNLEKEKSKLELNMTDETEMGDNFKFPNIKDKIKYFEKIKKDKSNQENLTESEEWNVNEDVSRNKNNTDDSFAQITVKVTKDIDKPKSLEKFMYESISKSFLTEFLNKQTVKYNETETESNNKIDRYQNKDNYESKNNSVKNIVNIFENRPLQKSIKEKKIVASNKKSEKEYSYTIIVEKPSINKSLDDKEDKIIKFKENSLQEINQKKCDKTFIRDYIPLSDCFVTDVVDMTSVNLKHNDMQFCKSALQDTTRKKDISNIGTQNIARSYNFASLLDRWKKEYHKAGGTHSNDTKGFYSLEERYDKRTRHLSCYNR